MRRHAELHRSDRIGWLRAAVLGANDGIVSTASLVLGVAAAGAEHRTILLTSVSGLIAGAMSMAAGEFVSVHSQSDTENAALAQERAELKQDPEGEQRELAGVYVGRGLDRPLAEQVAAKLTAHDALGAHARDELGFSDTTAARPLQAAWASAANGTTLSECIDYAPLLLFEACADDVARLSQQPMWFWSSLDRPGLDPVGSHRQQ